MTTKQTMSKTAEETLNELNVFIYEDEKPELIRAMQSFAEQGVKLAVRNLICPTCRKTVYHEEPNYCSNSCHLWFKQEQK